MSSVEPQPQQPSQPEASPTQTDGSISLVMQDPSLGIEAAHAFVPSGEWVLAGQVSWDNQSGSCPATLNYRVQTPDETAIVGFVSTMDFVDLGPMMQFTQPGVIQEPSLAPAKFYLTPPQYAAEFLAIRQVADLQQVEVVWPPTETQAHLDAMAAEFQSSLRAATGMSIEVGLTSAATQFSGTYAGRSYRYVVEVAIRSLKSQENVGFGPFTTNRWQALATLYYAATTERFDADRSMLKSIADSIVVNDKWREAVDQKGSELIQQAGVRQQQAWDRIRAQQAAHSAAVQQAPQLSFQQQIDNRAKANSQVFRGWDQAISGF